MNTHRYIYTLNVGKLDPIEPFKFTRGSKKYMGKAKNESGEIFNVYGASCGIASCMCAARAEKTP